MLISILPAKVHQIKEPVKTKASVLPQAQHRTVLTEPLIWLN